MLLAARSSARAPRIEPYGEVSRILKYTTCSSYLVSSCTCSSCNIRSVPPIPTLSKLKLPRFLCPKIKENFLENSSRDSRASFGLFDTTTATKKPKRKHTTPRDNNIFDGFLRNNEHKIATTAYRLPSDGWYLWSVTWVANPSYKRPNDDIRIGKIARKAGDAMPKQDLHK